MKHNKVQEPLSSSSWHALNTQTSISLTRCVKLNVFLKKSQYHEGYSSNKHYMHM